MNISISSRISSALTFCLVLLLICFSQNAKAQGSGFTVVLDAGHGGVDPGKPGLGAIQEKEIALSLAQKVGDLLDKKGIKVIYTRMKDTLINLKDRGRIANDANADLFVSIHCNSHTSNAYGTETFVLGTHANDKNFEVAKTENSVILMEDNYENNYKGFDPNSPESVLGLTLLQEEYLDQSIQVASLIEKNFTKVGRKSRGVKQAGFVVLHQTYMPSVLVETGFLSNKGEGNFLDSEKGQNKIAYSIYKGILTYRLQIAKNSISSPKKNVSSKSQSVSKPKTTSPKTKTTKKEVIKKETTSTPKITNQKTTEKKNSTTTPTKTTSIDEYKTIIKEPKVVKKEDSTPKIIAKEGVLFRIQIGSGRAKLKTNPSNFKGIKNVQRVRVNGLYKYFAEETSSYSSASKLKKEIRTKGYPGAFVVAFRDGVIIPIKEAVKN